MQLTKFDRWIREKYIYRTHIYTMRLPETGVPSDVLVEELEDSPTRRFRFRLVANETHDVDSVLRVLKEGNQMFATRIVEVNPWYKRFVAPEGKSFFYRLVWIGIALMAVAAIIAMGIRIAMNPKLQENLMEAFQLFKNG